MANVIKKIDIYLLRNFLGLFFATFFIAIFILLMQFMWMHVNDLVGKGIELSVLAEFFIYAVASVVPLALPLAILLSSLIAFGNLAEKVELTAMKASGISLFRIMRPLALTVALLSVGAFFFSNNVLPKSQMKLWALIFSLRQKAPELDIPVGEFYDEISGYNIYVREKRNGDLINLMIYDYSGGFENAAVMVADTGRLSASADKRYLILNLINGESFENLDKKQQRATGTTKNIPYRRETFTQKQLLIDFSTEFNRYDESILEDQHVSKNMEQLLETIDSLQQISAEKSREQSDKMIADRYFGRETTKDTVILPTELTQEQRSAYDLDTLWASMTLQNKKYILSLAYDKARTNKDQVDYNGIVLEDTDRTIRRHEIELHRKFTLAFACLIFFFIGAPLGAIIRKGGLGAPVVISVIMFIIYYIIDNMGFKMAREALWPCWEGMWLSSFVLLPIGIFLTYKAATDSPLFYPDAWKIKYKRWKEKIRTYANKHNRRSAT